MISRSATIINKLGLHARAATRLVNCASMFEAELWIRNGEKTINGKSIMGLMSLLAPMGTRLTITAVGEDAQEAVSALAMAVNKRFGEVG